MGDHIRQVLQMNDLSSVWMVGDRDSTDGAFARSIDAQFALVQSEINEGDSTEHPPPHLIVADLAQFAQYRL